MRYLDVNNSKNNRAWSRPPVRQKKSSRHRFVLLLLLVAFFAGAFIFRSSILSLLKPVSVFSQLIGPNAKLKEADGRTNILLIGVDRRSNAGYVGGVLTDTMIVLSVDSKSKSVVGVSLPRDLWVEPEGYQGYKINAFYSIGGIDETKEMVSGVLGIPIHYFAVIDFQTFEKIIDVLGGVDVSVEREFDDYKYPKAGFENAEPEESRYEHWHFDAGLQHMDGKKALVYARSRHALGPEGSDFARIRRQQRVIEAVKDKILSLSLLTNPAKLRDLYNLFASVETDVGWNEVESGALLARSASDFTFKFGLISADGDNPLLVNPTDWSLYGGQYVLVPEAGDYSEIHYYVQKLLFGTQ